ncbi:MAG: hypothetical protein M1831_005862 [Alyxoria varia]|nr:MAG: hypothetical protein M1831_005862 [Alyxoria varia]
MSLDDSPPPISSPLSSPPSEFDTLSLSAAPSSSTTPISSARSRMSSPPAMKLERVASTTSSSPSVEENDQPPAKRRKVNSGMPRDTKYLDLNEYTHNPQPGQKPSLDKLLRAIRNKKKIVVVAGAGISTSAGIPDFRSSTGLFKLLKEEHNLKGSGKDLFDAAVYRDAASTTTFHEMVKKMSEITKTKKPTPFHDMIARLAHEGRLLRLYSQNVDGLETSLTPLETKIPLPIKGPWPKTIQLHGGLEKMCCTKCNELPDFDPIIFNGPIPPSCEACKKLDDVRTQHAGKRSHGVGMLRPRMVLYNEHNPDDEAIGAVAKTDMRTRPDAVLVVGTSLKVPGVRRIVKEMCGIVRDRRDGLTAWINHDPVPSGKEFESAWDFVIKADADDIADRANIGKWTDPPPPPKMVERASTEEYEKAMGKPFPEVLVDSTHKRGDEPIDVSGKATTNQTADEKPVTDDVASQDGKEDRKVETQIVQSEQPQVQHRETVPLNNPASHQGKKLKTLESISNNSKVKANLKAAGKNAKPPSKTRNPKNTNATAKGKNGTAAGNIKLHYGVSKAGNAPPATATKTKHTVPLMQEMNSMQVAQDVPSTPTKPHTTTMDSVSPTNIRLNGLSSGSDSNKDPIKTVDDGVRGDTPAARTPKKEKSTDRASGTSTPRRGGKTQKPIKFPNMPSCYTNTRVDEVKAEGSGVDAAKIEQVETSV